MGMFDYISVSDQLPTNPEIEAAGINLYSKSYQTKDLDKCMDSYYIQTGKLFVEKYKTTKWIEDSESLLGGYIDRQDPYKEEIFDYHGKINFYETVTVDNFDHWIEYDAYFSHGALEKITLVKYKKTDNTERNRQLKELFDRINAEHKKWYNKYLFHTAPWGKVRKFIANCLYKTERALSNLRMKLP